MKQEIEDHLVAKKKNEIEFERSDHDLAESNDKLVEIESKVQSKVEECKSLDTRCRDL